MELRQGQRSVYVTPGSAGKWDQLRRPLIRHVERRVQLQRKEQQWLQRPEMGEVVLKCLNFRDRQHDILLHALLAT